MIRDQRALQGRRTVCGQSVEKLLTLRKVVSSEQEVLQDPEVKLVAADPISRNNIAVFCATSAAIRSSSFCTTPAIVTPKSCRVVNYRCKEYPELEDFGDARLVGKNGVTYYFRADWLTPKGGSAPEATGAGSSSGPKDTSNCANTSKSSATRLGTICIWSTTTVSSISNCTARSVRSSAN